MALTRESFALTDDELAKINAYCQQRAAGYAQEGEDPAQQVNVIFEFVAGLGRGISVAYDGQVEPTVIVDVLEL